MNELRWILIGFGIVLLAGIYLWGRRGSAAVAEDVALRSQPEAGPQGFADFRREPAMHREDGSSYDEPSYERSYEEEEEPEEAGRVLERADDYEVTAARPINPRSEGRLTRAESPRPIVREVAPASSEAPRAVPDFRRSRVEPTLGTDAVTEELRVQPADEETASASAPTLSSSDSPSPRRSNVRKILSLRLTLTPQKIEGAKLAEVLQEELLTHGKYEIFHRLHSDSQSVFSIASMVEPGSSIWRRWARRSIRASPCSRSCPGRCPACMHSMSWSRARAACISRWAACFKTIAVCR